MSMIGLSNANADSPSQRTPFTKVPVQIADKAAAPYHVTVKFVDAAQIRAGGDSVWSLSGVSTTALQAFITTSQLTLSPEFRLSSGTLSALAAEAAANSGVAQPDLGGVFRLGFATSDPSQQQAIANQLQDLPLVEYVQSVSSTPPPPADIPPTTPLYESQQHYFTALPGLEFNYANGLGLTGQGMQYVDIEYCWVLDHEDIDGQLLPEEGIIPTFAGFDAWCFHGIAATGVLTARPNAYGMKGAAPAARAFVHTEHGGETEQPLRQRRAEAIGSGQSRTSPGDVLMLEMQQCFDSNPCNDCSGRCGPAEIELAVWMATKMATDAGRVVVAAAGNGGVDMDGNAPGVAAYRRLGDSGAIIVGAGTPTPSLLPQSFSTYGSRVNLQAWGDGVGTLGYFFPVPGAPSDRRQTYTPWFSGTSSATPLVTASALLTQQHAKIFFGIPMSPRELRGYLRATGTPQGPDPRQIGPLPNMRSAIDRIDEADVSVAAFATESQAGVGVLNLGPSRARQLVIDIAIISSSVFSIVRVDSSPATCVSRPDPPDTFCAGQCSYLRCTYPELIAGYQALDWQCTSSTGASAWVSATIVSGAHTDPNASNNFSTVRGPLCTASLPM